MANTINPAASPFVPNTTASSSAPTTGSPDTTKLKADLQTVANDLGLSPSTFAASVPTNLTLAQINSASLPPLSTMPADPHVVMPWDYNKLSVNTGGDTITTPGGYKIQMTGQFGFKITGPDGKNTEIWGDPHVKASNGGHDWQFKRDGEFCLPDGTRIAVNVKPYGNGATVTSSLEIFNQGSHISVGGIDKGKGVIGPVQNDGFDAVVKLDQKDMGSKNQRDYFDMGSGTNDWSNLGREIVGSEDQGAKYKYGKFANPLDTIAKTDTSADWAKGWLNSLLSSPGFQNPDPAAPKTNWNQLLSSAHVSDSAQLMQDMMQVIGDWQSLQNWSPKS